jgi:hypothetical protein
VGGEGRDGGEDRDVEESAGGFTSTKVLASQYKSTNTDSAVLQAENLEMEAKIEMLKKDGQYLETRERERGREGGREEGERENTFLG